MRVSYDGANRRRQIRELTRRHPPHFWGIVFSVEVASRRRSAMWRLTMGKFLAALGLSTGLAAAAALPLATQAQAAMSYSGQGAADLQHQTTPVEKAQFFWGGNNWCWYPIGWHGPGWYWCGYDWNNGYGWGGPYGWNGWFVAPYYRYGHRPWYPPPHGPWPPHGPGPWTGGPHHPWSGGPMHPMMRGPMGQPPHGGGGPNWQHK
jgi:hypothetical protein